MASTPASEVCLQHCVGHSETSTLGLSLPFPGVLSEPLQPRGGEGGPRQWDTAPAAPILQHLSARPELTDGRAPLLLAPVQAAW